MKATLSLWIIAAAVTASASAPAAAADTGPAGPAVQADTQGFLYGRVITRRTTYEGRLRWDDEEAFWDDIFNGTKDEMPYLEDVPRDARRRREPVRLLGITIGSRWNEDSHRRQAAARFGDIVAIEPGRSDHVTLTMKSGTRIEIDGGSNDVGADIVVWDLERGETTLDWDDVERVELLPTPADLTVDAYRLFGTAKTAAGTFRGYVLWDADECFSTDTLDGEDSDGRDVELPMGEIATIERRSRSSSRVILHDGREMILDGTNDVDDSIRGILIEDPRYGRVGISWDAFERLDFELAEDAGPPYQTFEPAERLTGTVTTTDGTRHRGQVIYDLDESETWEMLDAKRDGVEYSIPFSLIRVIEPRGDNASRIRLIGGEDLELEGTADVNEDNAGILVITEGGAKRYVPWREVAKVELGL